MGGFLAKSDVKAKVEREAFTGHISEHGIIGLQDGAVKNTIHRGRITGIQDGGVRGTVRQGALQV